MNPTETPLISIILPVYNVSAYLRPCLDSVINQDYKNLEIILVDDGSTDISSSICDEYSEKDGRIRVIHKKNGGLSDARNAGAEIAEGEYITFVDSDDRITEDYVSYLYSLIKAYNTKMSLCTHTVVFENGRRLVYGDGGRQCLDAETCIKRMLYHDVIDTSAWAKMYHRNLVKEIQYPVGMHYEDIGTTYKFFMAAGKIACGYQSKYFYFVRKNSIVTASFNPKKFDLITMTDQMGKDVLNRYPSLDRAVLRRRVYARFSVLNQMSRVNGYEAERKELIAFIKKYRHLIIADSLAPKRDKAAVLLLSISYRLYRKVWDIRQKELAK